MSISADTIVGALWHRAALHETTPVLRFLSSGDITGPTTEWDFPTLHRQALRIAADLAGRGAPRRCRRGGRSSGRRDLPSTWSLRLSMPGISDFTCR